MKKDHVIQELKKLYRCLDFVSNEMNRKGVSEKQKSLYFDIYRQLRFVWEYLGSFCKHWNGFRKEKGKPYTCKICGKVKD